MYFKIVLFAWMALSVMACNQNPESRLQPAAEGHGDHTNDHEEPKFQYTAYSNHFEVFAEADAFVTGKQANVLAHFSILPGFRALEEGKITLVLSIDGSDTRLTLEKPTRKGIYSFDITPGISGNGWLVFEIERDGQVYKLSLPDITVFSNHQTAHDAASRIRIPGTNATPFTKEQSWKIDFATGLPEVEPFGQVIHTTALVQSTQGEESLITAKTAGLVVITTNNLLEGTAVHAGQILCLVSGSSLTDNNITLKYTEAKNNYEKAKSDFERLNELAGDNIISGKEMLNAKNAYENAKALFDNLNQDYSAAGQLVKSPMNGYIKQIFVRNGMHVETGQPIASVTQDKTLWLSAELPGRYASMLTKIQSATIRENTNGQVFSLEELNGKILSVGKAVNPDNFLIPVTLQVENKGQFVNGSFVQVSLKTVTDNKALTVASSALLEDQGSYFVWVQITPELFEKRMVNIGGTDGIKTEIMAGLNENERVVTRGAVMIKLAQATGGLDAHAGHVH